MLYEAIRSGKGSRKTITAYSTHHTAPHHSTARHGTAQHSTAHTRSRLSFPHLVLGIAADDPAKALHTTQLQLFIGEGTQCDLGEKGEGRGGGRGGEKEGEGEGEE